MINDLLYIWVYFYSAMVMKLQKKCEATKFRSGTLLWLGFAKRLPGVCRLPF